MYIFTHSHIQTHTLVKASTKPLYLFWTSIIKILGYIHIYMYICLYIHMCVYVFMFVCMYIFTHSLILTHTHACESINKASLSILNFHHINCGIYIYIYICVCVCVCVCLYVCMYVCMCIFAHSQSK